jgi:hypothetical protein
MLKIHEVACGVSFPQSRLIDAHEGDKLERAMLNYKPGDDVGPLEDWPFENPKSNYQFKEGDPKASGRIDAGGPGHKGQRDCSTYRMLRSYSNGP